LSGCRLPRCGLCDLAKPIPGRRQTYPLKCVQQNASPKFSSAVAWNRSSDAHIDPSPLRMDARESSESCVHRACFFQQQYDGVLSPWARSTVIRCQPAPANLGIDASLHHRAFLDQSAPPQNPSPEMERSHHVKMSFLTVSTPYL
jgi:hypothetical protein